MDRFLRHSTLLCIAALASACSAPSTQEADTAHRLETAPPTAPASPAADASTGVQPSQTPDPLACAKDEELLFGCTIASTGKTMSLCTKDGSAAATRYRFGTPAHLELEWPDKVGDAATGFSRTSLLFAGNTGGYAYSFRNAGTTYALYSVSGEDGLARSGVAVLDGHGKKVASLECQPDSFRETESVSTIRATRGWSPDPLVEKAEL